MVHKSQKMKTKKKKISAVIACYLDAKAIPEMHQRLKKTFQKIHVNYEIIFVNDGSPDNTETILKKITKKDSKVIAVNHSRNFSSQMAFTSGMDIATGDAVVFLDGDLQDPPEIIEKYQCETKKVFEEDYTLKLKEPVTIIRKQEYK